MNPKDYEITDAQIEAFRVDGSIVSTCITMAAARAAYRAANNAGDGYAPDTIGDDSIDDAVSYYVQHGGVLLLPRETSEDVAVVQVHGQMIAIGGDAMGRGAWAVDVEGAK